MKLDQNRIGVVPPRSVGSDHPFALTYSAVLPVGAVKRPLEQLYFKNPYRGPMWADEFHFTVQTLSNFFIYPTVPFAMRMKVNGKYITEEYVPFTLLGPQTDIGEVVTQSPQTLSFFWRLAKPMWLDELDDLLIELTWLGDLPIYGVNPPVQSTTVSVTLCGRATKSANRPSQRHLPFNAVWGPNFFAAPPVSENVLRSPDSALRNNRNTAVNITRLLGTVPMNRPDAGNASTSNELLNLRISHSLGYYIVKDLTPFYELFQNVSRAADIKFTLQPKEFLTIELQTTPIIFSGFPTPPATTFNYIPAFALQGYSTEVLR